jgi:hypothetical protein
MIAFLRIFSVTSAVGHLGCYLSVDGLKLEVLSDTHFTDLVLAKAEMSQLRGIADSYRQEEKRLKSSVGQILSIVCMQ